LGEAGAVTILVIDDEALVRKLTRRALESVGYIVWDADSGAAGLGVLAEQEPPIALVLLDMSMPGMSGEETLRAIHARHRVTRVVILSGFEEESVAAFALEGLIDGFIQKPFTLEALHGVVEVALVAVPSGQAF